MFEFDPRLCGWVDSPELREEAFRMLPDHCKTPFRINGVKSDKKRMMLFEVVRQVAKDQGLQTDENGDIPNIRQEIGDCVSWGAKHVIEYLQCCQIALGNFGKLTLVFSPYLYGCGRVYIGGGQMRGQDGSVGGWMASAVIKYGTIALDAPNVPPYSGSVAKKWGDSRQTLDQFVPIGQQHLIKTTNKISTWENLVDAVTNLYPVTVASNVGFTMTPQGDGFHHRSGQWGHQMAIVGVDDEGGNIEPHACVLNSWGDAMGRVTDFRNPNLKWPVGTLRVRKRDIEAMLAEDDSYSYSMMIDFPGRMLPEDFFDMI